MIIVIVSFFFEMFLFPSLENFLGGVMAIVAFIIYKYFLNTIIIKQYPFSFLMFTSMFLFRYLPIVATLLEGKPVNYGMQLAGETFFYEILLFSISAFAFYLACPKQFSKRNTTIKILLNRAGLFEANHNMPRILWFMGFIGLFAYMNVIISGDASTGDVYGKFLNGLTYLAYAPTLILFPSLTRLPQKNNKINFQLVGLYTFVLLFVAIAFNSREKMIWPIATIFILFFLNAVINDLKISSVISKTKIIFITLFMIFGLSTLSDISLAMVNVRGSRSDISKMELLQLTISSMQDKKQMNFWKLNAQEADGSINSYDKGWDESYVSNFMLSRYANMRVSDQTLYHAKKKGFNNPKMRNYFFNRIVALLPTPLLNFLNLHIDKDKLQYSPGDLLVGPNLGSFRVSGHIGIGLATFGHIYFLLQFMANFFVFKLLNTFVLNTSRGLFYSPYGLISCFAFLGMFRNASGILMDTIYIFRGYIQGIVTYLIIYRFIKLFFPEKKSLALITDRK